MSQPFAFRLHSSEITPLLDTARARQPQRRRRSVTHAQRLDRREAFAPDASAISQGSTTALARIASQKSVLSFAAAFGRLVLTFHALSNRDEH